MKIFATQPQMCHISIHMNLVASIRPYNTLQTTDLLHLLHIIILSTDGFLYNTIIELNLGAVGSANANQ